MYLSRLVLNPRSCLVCHDLADCQSLHRTVLSAFPTKSNGIGAREEVRGASPPGALTMGRRIGTAGAICGSADWNRLPQEYLAPSATATKPASVSQRPFLDSLQQGETLRFRLRANPTKKVDTKSGPNGERRNGRRVKLTTEAEQVAWLQRKASKGSFEVLAVKTSADTAALDVVDERQTKGWRSGTRGTCRAPDVRDYPVQRSPSDYRSRGVPTNTGVGSRIGKSVRLRAALAGRTAGWEST